MEVSGAKEKKAYEDLDKLRVDLHRSQELVAKLESDLENTSFNGQRSPDTSGSKSRGSLSAPDANLVALLSSGEGEGTRSSGKGATGVAGAGEGQMLAILTSQRDRYKERLDSMEGIVAQSATGHTQL